jgi:outer membrane lipoprotein LolB
VTRRGLGRFAAGCASVAPPGLPPGLISGRLALQVAATPTEPARQVSGSFELRGDAARGQLDLVSPLGITVAQARWLPGRVELLNSGDGPIVFESLDELSTRAFGEPLPLAALFDWLRGRPWPGAPSLAASDGSGFEQMGWVIDTSRLADGQIIARRPAPPAVTLRARMESS